MERFKRTKRTGGATLTILRFNFFIQSKEVDNFRISPYTNYWEKPTTSSHTSPNISRLGGVWYAENRNKSWDWKGGLFLESLYNKRLESHVLSSTACSSGDQKSIIWRIWMGEPQALRCNRYIGWNHGTQSLNT